MNILIGVRLRETAPADDYKLVDLFARVGDLVLVETRRRAARRRGAPAAAGRCRSTSATSSTGGCCAWPPSTRRASTASGASARQRGRRDRAGHRPRAAACP